MSDNKSNSSPAVSVNDAMITGFSTREEYAILLESGAIPSSMDTVEKCMAIVSMGKELGLQPMVAINNINIIKGRTVISSTMLGAMLKQRNIEWVWTKDHSVEELADGNIRIVTELEFEWISKVTGRPKSAKFSVTMGQMELAGYTTKDNWQKLPKEMLRARCLSSAVRAYFPEVLMGVYTDLEMADATNADYKTRLTEDGDIEVIQDAEEV
jgi:hypothetical protein